MAHAAEEVVAFPQLTEAELNHVRPLAEACTFADGDEVFKAGGNDGIAGTLSFGPYRVYVRSHPEAPGVKSKKK